MAPSSLPQLTFEGVWGSTTYLDIALDAISIHRGSCNRGEPMSASSLPPPFVQVPRWQDSLRDRDPGFSQA